MFLDHLYYCVKEMDTAYRFVKIQNNDFYKRTVARLIALRTDDFISIALRQNNLGPKSAKVRADLLALENYYKDFFELQRDKFSAHFQKLDLATTVDAWNEINFERVDFFYSMSKDCYALFKSEPGHIPLIEQTLSETELASIGSVNNDLDIENFPNMGSDLLAITRPNSSGLINASTVSRKMGVLKSIELVINYELAIIDALPPSSDIYEMFCKLFVVDLVSYCDNLYTRSDVVTNSPNYEVGLDNFTTPPEMASVLDLLTEFRTNYKFDDQVLALRAPRNIVCGHIDVSHSVSNLRSSLQRVDLLKARRFFGQLKDLYRSICFSYLPFRTYAFDATEKVEGVGRFVGMPVKTFDGTQPPDHEVELPDVRDVDQYKLQFSKWLTSDDPAALSYFYDCFNCAPIVKTAQVVEDFSSGGSVTRGYEFRLTHQYFYEKLGDTGIPNREKLRILDLFKSLRQGHPSILGQILLDTFDANPGLQRHYLYHIGYLVKSRSEDLLAKYEDLRKSGSRKDRYVALTSVWRCDLRARYVNTSRHFAGDTVFSKYLSEQLGNMDEAFEKLFFSTALASVYLFDNVIHTSEIETKHVGMLRTVFENALFQLAAMCGVTWDDERIQAILTQFSVYRFAEVSFRLSSFFEDLGQAGLAIQCREMVIDGYVFFNRSDLQEGEYFALVHFYADRLNEAIVVQKWLVKQRPHEIGYRTNLLTMFLTNNRFQAEFEIEKAEVLNNFNLDEQMRQSVEAMVYA